MSLLVNVVARQEASVRDDLESARVAYCTQQRTKVAEDSNGVRSEPLPDSIFSADFNTQFLNTVAMRRALRNAIKGAAEELKVGVEASTTGKGDDSTIEAGTLAELYLAYYGITRVRVDTSSSKTHVEVGMLELEKCLIECGEWHPPLARRLGSMVVSEPQGAGKLGTREMLTLADTMYKSIVLWAGLYDVANLVFESAMVTDGRGELLNGRDLFLMLPSCFGGLGMLLPPYTWIRDNCKDMETQSEKTIHSNCRTRLMKTVAKQRIEGVEQHIAKSNPGLSSNKKVLEKESSYVVMSAVQPALPPHILEIYGGDETRYLVDACSSLRSAEKWAGNLCPTAIAFIADELTRDVAMLRHDARQRSCRRWLLPASQMFRRILAARSITDWESACAAVGHTHGP
eukprot:2669334-Amphidinium_carterae.1